MKTKSLLPILAMFCGSLSLLAQNTLPLNIRSATPKDAVTQNSTQIEKIVHNQKTNLGVIQMPRIFGPAYTVSIWVKLDDSPALMEKGFTKTAPVNIIDLHSKDINEQRILIRIMDGAFAISELREGPSKWRTIGGIKIKPEPGKWYHIAYSASPQSGIFCLNGDIIARTVSPAPQDKIQNIIFGRVQNTRKLDGIILQPRLYNEALNLTQIQELYKNPPPEAK